MQIVNVQLHKLEKLYYYEKEKKKKKIRSKKSIQFQKK